MCSASDQREFPFSWTSLPDGSGGRLAGKTNGELLQLAQGRFDAFITLDKGLPHQQNLANLRIAVIVIRAKTNQLGDVLPHVPDCLDVLDMIKAGEVRYVGI